MKLYYELDLERFDAWSGAVETLDRIIKNGKCREFEAILEDAYPEGLDETQLNDILWFEEEWVYEVLGITDEEEVDEEFEIDIDELDEEVKEDFEIFNTFEKFCDTQDCDNCIFTKLKTMAECETKWAEIKKMLEE